jgi:hypothetical protein
MTAPYVPQTWVNGPGGGTPISAGRLNHMEAGIAAASGGAASALGIVNCSQMTTASEINAAALAAATASPVDEVVIWLGARLPDSQLVLDQPLIRRPRQHWKGLGGRQMLTVVEAGPSFPAGQPVMASEGYMTNATSADEPGSVTGIHIDVNAKTGSHGLVVYDFWSEFHDIQVEGCDGTNAHGIHVTDRGIDGVTVSTNSHSENRFSVIRCMGFTNGAHGFWAESTNGLNNSNQDGHLIDSYFAGVNGHAVNITRAAGWTIKNCHLYGIGLDGIRVANCYATKVTDCYIENFGQQDQVGQTYVGINFTTILDSDRASVCMGNTVSTQQPSSPNGALFACYFFRANTSQLRAAVAVDGNTATLAMSSAPAVKRSQAFRFGIGGDTGRLLQVQWGSNLVQNVDWWERTRVTNSAVDMRGSNQGAVTLPDVASPLIVAPMGNVFELTAATTNRTLPATQDPVHGQGIVIKHTASGGARTLALTTGVAGAFRFGSDVTGLTVTASGATDYIGCVYDGPDQRWDVVSYSKGFA